jgi:DNA (cytosine-5)-methyltransferase 1
LGPVDCITYGFPCQDLSVAGRRAGLDGDRSKLFFEAIRIIKEMRDATDGRYPTFAVAENVSGLLNADRGHAMGRCLDALAEIGAVGIEWAVLDAQHFGVPQRRQRVFLVAWFDPRINNTAEILPVAKSCRRDSATGDPSRQEIAGSIAYGLGGDHSVAGTIGNLTGGMRTTDLDSVGANVKVRRAQSDTDFESWASDLPAPTLNAFDNNTESRATVLALLDVPSAPVAIATNSPERRVSHAVVSKWAKGSGGPAGDETQNMVPSCNGVRRLTPRECERLMGWPDDHTRWSADEKEIADTNRYKMCGNGVAAPVAEWVARRLSDVLAGG